MLMWGDNRLIPITDRNFFVVWVYVNDVFRAKGDEHYTLVSGYYKYEAHR